MWNVWIVIGEEILVRDLILIKFISTIILVDYVILVVCELCDSEVYFINRSEIITWTCFFYLIFISSQLNSFYDLHQLYHFNEFENGRSHFIDYWHECNPRGTGPQSVEVPCSGTSHLPVDHIPTKSTRGAFCEYYEAVIA